MSDYNRYYGGDDRGTSGGQQPYSTEYYTVGSPDPAPQPPQPPKRKDVYKRQIINKKIRLQRDGQGEKT